MTSDEQRQQQGPVNANAILADHALVASNPQTNLWPIAIGVVATILVLAGAASALFQRESLEAKIATLSKELISSRSSVERLIAENAVLTRKLNDLVGSAQPLSSVIESESSVRTDSTDPDIDHATEETAVTCGGASGEKFASTQGLDNRAGTGPITTTGVDDPLHQSGAPPRATERAGGPQKVSALPETDSGAISNDAGNDLGPWAVVVGAFSSKNNLNNLVSALEDEDYSVTTQSIARGGRELQQVKVIGFKTRSGATTAASAIELAYRTGRLRVVVDPIVEGNSKPSESHSNAPLSSPSKELALSNKQKDVSPSPTEYDNAGGPEFPEKTGSANVGWFVFVDTFSDSTEAADLARDLSKKGYNVKVAVEYRSGNLYYRVQVVGIDSRQAGEDIVNNLVEAGDLPNIQLRTF